MKMALNANKLNNLRFIRENFNILSIKLLNYNIPITDLEEVCNKRTKNNIKYLYLIFLTILSSVFITVCTDSLVLDLIVKYAFGTRCFIPNNYLVWESTRPISDCKFCEKVSGALILPNLTRKEFSQFAYSSQPIILKRAVKHWPAMDEFSYEFFQSMYNSVDGAYESIEEGCQFLHFQSDFISVRDLFSMSKNRSQNFPGEKSWYVGLGNCHPEILRRMRKFYPIPHFLPDDAEISLHEYIFFGYNDGATMHLDYIPRLMWQAQLSGNKTWHLIPTPECEQVCQSVSFYVEPGDAVLLDTRIWYHSTRNTPGEFSLTLQSEYG